ncbi:MAG: YtxH-like protein [Candidatus Parcubacteria bacterium]|jgi:gas vesicle protein
MKKSKFGIGLFIGAVAGVLTGLLVAPKAGKKTREELAKKLKQLRKSVEDGELPERVKEVFGDVSDESIRLYKNAKKNLIKKLDEISDDIDFEKYKKIVTDVISGLSDGAKTSGEKLTALKDRLIEEWSDDEEAAPSKKSSK